MPRLKITTVSKEFRTAWVEVSEEKLALLRGDKHEAFAWAYEQIAGGLVTEFSGAGDSGICFVDTEGREALYER